MNDENEKEAMHRRNTPKAIVTMVCGSIGGWLLLEFSWQLVFGSLLLLIAVEVCKTMEDES